MDGHRKGESREPEDRLQRNVVLRRKDAGKQVLVVSDLHLGSGREKGTGRYRPRENFFADDAFYRFLMRQISRAPEPGLLVLNGDTIDFVRIMGVPRTKGDFRKWRRNLAALGRERSVEELRRSIDEEEEWRFGLRADEFKSVWRVRRVIRGHGEFFASLRSWVRAGGQIVFVKGNHDLELRWPLVREAIRLGIKGNEHGLRVSERVRFSDRSVRLENLHIEHGHRFEPATTVNGAATTNDGREIRLPVGSVMNRYLINKLEEIEPFLNNIKPALNAVRAVAHRHPCRFFRQLWRAAPYVCRSVRRHGFRNGIGILVYLAAALAFFIGLVLLTGVLVVTLLGFAVVLPIEDVPVAMPRLLTTWHVILLVAIALPIADAMYRAVRRFGAVLYRCVSRRRKFPDAEDRHAQKLFEHLQETCIPSDAENFYGVIGHTHRPDVQVLDLSENRRLTYLNSGTWTPNWRDKRSNLRAGTEFSFLRFEWKPRFNEYRHSSRVWRDDRGVEGESVENVIIAPERSMA